MSEKNTNVTTTIEATTVTTATTATTVAKTSEATPSKKSSNTTTSKKGDTTMKSTTKSTKSATAATTMSAQEFKQKSYDAYLSYVSYIEGKLTGAETVEALSPIMSAYGFALTVDNLGNILTVKMTAFGKDKGEQAKKVKSISTFRAFIKEGWKAVVAAPVHSNAGKNPADVKTSEKVKKPTKADLEAQVLDDALRIAELEALLAKANAAEKKSEETAAAETKAA